MTGATADPGAGPALDAARRDLFLTNLDLWLAYFGLGGNLAFEEMQSYLAGTRPVGTCEHNTLVLALNESYLDAGADHPVPYLD